VNNTAMFPAVRERDNRLTVGQIRLRSELLELNGTSFSRRRDFRLREKGSTI
jgi:hypothetical protein